MPAPNHTEIKEDLNDRFERGLALMREYWGGPHERKREDTDAYVEKVITHVFADVWTREGLSLRERSMITLTVLVAQGREDELQLHIKGALNVGVEPKAIEEMFIHLACYVGVPLSRSGWMTAKPVLAEFAAKRSAAAKT